MMDPAVNVRTVSLKEIINNLDKSIKWSQGRFVELDNVPLSITKVNFLIQVVKTYLMFIGQTYDALKIKDESMDQTSNAFSTVDTRRYTELLGFLQGVFETSSPDRELLTAVLKDFLQQVQVNLGNVKLNKNSFEILFFNPSKSYVAQSVDKLVIVNNMMDKLMGFYNNNTLVGIPNIVPQNGVETVIQLDFDKILTFVGNLGMTLPKFRAKGVGWDNMKKMMRKMGRDEKGTPMQPLIDIIGEVSNINLGTLFEKFLRSGVSGFNSKKHATKVVSTGKDFMNAATVHIPVDNFKPIRESTTTGPTYDAPDLSINNPMTQVLEPLSRPLRTLLIKSMNVNEWNYGDTILIQRGFYIFIVNFISSIHDQMVLLRTTLSGQEQVITAQKKTILELNTILQRLLNEFTEAYGNLDDFFTIAADKMAELLQNYNGLLEMLSKIGKINNPQDLSAVIQEIETRQRILDTELERQRVQLEAENKAALTNLQVKLEAKMDQLKAEGERKITAVQLEMNDTLQKTREEGQANVANIQKKHNDELQKFEQRYRKLQDDFQKIRDDYNQVVTQLNQKSVENISLTKNLEELNSKNETLKTVVGDFKKELLRLTDISEITRLARENEQLRGATEESEMTIAQQKTELALSQEIIEELNKYRSAMVNISSSLGENFIVMDEGEIVLETDDAMEKLVETIKRQTVLIFDITRNIKTALTDINSIFVIEKEDLELLPEVMIYLKFLIQELRLKNDKVVQTETALDRFKLLYSDMVKAKNVRAAAQKRANREIQLLRTQLAKMRRRNRGGKQIPETTEEILEMDVDNTDNLSLEELLALPEPEPSKRKSDDVALEELLGEPTLAASAKDSFQKLSLIDELQNKFDESVQNYEMIIGDLSEKLELAENGNLISEIQRYKEEVKILEEAMDAMKKQHDLEILSLAELETGPSDGNLISEIQRYKEEVKILKEAMDAMKKQHDLEILSLAELETGPSDAELNLIAENDRLKAELELRRTSRRDVELERLLVAPAEKTPLETDPEELQVKLQEAKQENLLLSNLLKDMEKIMADQANELLVAQMMKTPSLQQETGLNTISDQNSQLLDELSKALEESKLNENIIKKSRDELSNKVLELNGEIQLLNSSLATYKMENERLNKEIFKMELKVVELGNPSDKLLATQLEVDRLKVELQQAQKEIEDVNILTQNSITAEEKSQREIQVLNSKIQNSNFEIDSLKDELAQKTLEVDTILDQKMELEVKIQQLNKQIEEAEQQQLETDNSMISPVSSPLPVSGGLSAEIYKKQVAELSSDMADLQTKYDRVLEDLEKKKMDYDLLISFFNDTAEESIPVLSDNLPRDNLTQSMKRINDLLEVVKEELNIGTKRLPSANDLRSVLRARTVNRRRSERLSNNKTFQALK